MPLPGKKLIYGQLPVATSLNLGDVKKLSCRDSPGQFSDKLQTYPGGDSWGLLTTLRMCVFFTRVLDLHVDCCAFVFVNVCVCLRPRERNGPWRQASIHQRAAGISAPPEYRWPSGAGRRAPPSSHRPGEVWVCVRIRYRHAKCSRCIHIYVEEWRGTRPCTTPAPRATCGVCVCVYVRATADERPPDCHRSLTHQAST